MPPHRSRWTDGNDWRSMAMKLLLGGGLLAILLAYTDAIKDYTRTGEAVTTMQALMAEHSRVLKERELDAAVLRSEFLNHKTQSDSHQIESEREIEKHDAELREIEREMNALARGARP